MVRDQLVAGQGGDEARGRKHGYLGPKMPGRGHAIAHENGQLIDPGGHHEPEESPRTFDPASELFKGVLS